MEDGSPEMVVLNEDVGRQALERKEDTQ